MEIRTAPPRIPDHEVLRCIGKGSYGEVWLARAVTGTLRAVKVVHRADFELDRTFEREFEGIMKFEPISREHPGLVHVLHVGRNDEEKFYYYVMELGDDRERGSRVDPGDYEPRTMGTDRAMKHRLPAAECIEQGAQVAEGLAHMHECGLTHRDIKPSNVIFVNGRAKLADIGLVAAAGQMTFVGTEGFVPPEGPGTKQADVYSLGMVLYELSTGKDRLLFPELPDDLDEARSRPQWQALNEIILRACSNQPKKRFATAREMAQALRLAARKKQVGVNWTKRLIQFPLVTAAIAFVLVTWRHHGAMPWPPGRFSDKTTGIAPPPSQALGKVRLESNPPGADIYYQGRSLGRTPWTCEVAPGEAQFVLKKPPYRDELVVVPGVEADKLSTMPAVNLRPMPPVPGKPWNNSLGMPFQALPDGSHVSDWPISEFQFNRIQQPQRGGIEEERFPIRNADNTFSGKNSTAYLIQVPLAEALRFCSQLTALETQLENLTPDLYYRPEIYHHSDPSKEKTGQVFFKLAVEKYGSVTISSIPPGAAIYEGDKPDLLGYTPKTIERQLPGDLEFTLSLSGYTDARIAVKLKPGEHRDIPEDPTLVKSSLAVFGNDWRNSLRQLFKPLPGTPDLLIAEKETRVMDYALFAKETGRQVRKNDMKQAPNHPVVNVTRADARAYCLWLTARERKSGFLNETMEYRLPTDTEWSRAVASPNLVVEQVTPAQRNMTITGLYPWDVRYFPPGRADASSNHPKASANLGDLSALKAGELKLSPEEVKELEASKYDDGQVFTAPVGSYAPGPYDLYDMSGNVWEFVNDDYGAKTVPVAGEEEEQETPSNDHDQSKYAVLRGAAWDTAATDRVKLAIHYRRAIAADKFDNTSGFRIVVAPLPGMEPEKVSVPVPPQYPNFPFSTPGFSQPPSTLQPSGSPSPLPAAPMSTPMPSNPTPQPQTQAQGSIPSSGSNPGNGNPAGGSSSGNRPGPATGTNSAGGNATGGLYPGPVGPGNPRTGTGTGDPSMPSGAGNGVGTGTGSPSAPGNTSGPGTGSGSSPAPTPGSNASPNSGTSVRPPRELPHYIPMPMPAPMPPPPAAPAPTSPPSSKGSPL